MQEAMSGLLGFCNYLYVDDMVCYSATMEDHYRDLGKVFKALEKGKFKIKLQKCSFFRKHLTFLGFRIGQEGISVDPDKLKVIREMQTPRRVDELQSFSGFFNLFRHLIKDYGIITKPLNHLLKKKVEFIWGAEQAEALATLQGELLKEPVLAYPNLSL